MTKMVWAVAAMMAIAVASGCRSTSFTKVTGYPVPEANGLEEADVEKAMLAAGADRGWALKKIGKLSFDGMLNHRGHYVKNRFAIKSGILDITYLDSQDMAFTGSSIHRNYYNWNVRYVSSLRQQLRDIKIKQFMKQ